MLRVSVVVAAEMPAWPVRRMKRIGFTPATKKWTGGEEHMIVRGYFKTATLVCVNDFGLVLVGS